MKKTIIFCVVGFIVCWSGLFGFYKILPYKQPIIVKVLVTSNDNDSWEGTGFFVDDNLLMTAGHIVEDANRIVIQYSDNKMLEAEIWKDANDCDVGLIKVSTPEKESKVKLVDADIKDKITIIGNPGGYFPVTSIGIISGKNIEESFFGSNKFLLSDCLTGPGNSGSPVFNRRNNVVGIVIGGAYGFTVIVAGKDCERFVEESKLWAH